MIVALSMGCSEPGHAPGPSFHPPDTGADADTDTDADTDADTDSGSGDTDTDTETYGPDIVEAVIAHPAPEATSCTRIDDGLGKHPTLSAIGDRWFAFYTEGEYNTESEVVLRTSPIDDPLFDEPVRLLMGAREVDIIDEGNRFLAMVSRMLYAVALESVDGVGWTELGYVAPDEPTYDCEGYPPVKISRGESPAGFVAMGHDYNTGIFGCTDRVFAAVAKDDFWEVPEQAGKGDVVFAYEGSSRLTVVSTFGVYTSIDKGETFSEFEDGDTTASQLKGTGATWTGSRLIITQSYNWANEYSIAAITSDDDGATWPTRIILTSGSSPIFAPIIASDGDQVVVAWIVSGAVWAMTSPDSGDTWSEPGKLSNPTEDSGASKLSIAVKETSIGILFAGDGVQFCSGNV